MAAWWVNLLAKALLVEINATDRQQNHPSYECPLRMAVNNPMQDSDAQLAHVTSYLRSELGYESEAPGTLRRHVEENTKMIRSIENTLRGTGDELGVVGWISIFRRTWITLVALLGAAAGYLLNDVVHGIHPERGVATHIESRQ